MKPNKLGLIIGVVIIIVISYMLLVLKPSSGLVGSNSQSQSENTNQAVIPTPTPTPIPIDSKTDLLKMIDSLSPDDFSQDFQKLTPR